MRKAKPKRKSEEVVYPAEGTNRGKVFDLMRTKGLTHQAQRYMAEFLTCTTQCPVEAMFLTEDVFLKDEDRHHLEPIREILIEAGYYTEMREVVKPAPLLFSHKGKVYYYPHRVPLMEWLDKHA